MYGMKLSLSQVWDRIAALTGVSRSTAQKIVEEKKKVNYWASDIARDEMPKQKIVEEKKKVNYWASDIARDEMPEPVVIYLNLDDDDFVTDTARENEDEI